MSAIGARPAPRSPRGLPVGAKCVAAGGVCTILLSSAASTTVVDCVVATQLTTTLSGVTPLLAAAASCELVSWRSGSRAQAVALSSSGSVDLRPEHKGLVRLARKYGVSGVASLPAASVTPVVTTAM